MFITRQLYYINAKDYADLEMVAKVLPFLDDFVNNDKICNDINNSEDLNLIHCSEWDYEVQKEEKKESAKPEKDSDSERDEDDLSIEEEEEKEAEVADAEKEKPVTVNNNSFSLRDLRSMLIKLFTVYNILENIPHKNKFGVYVVDVTVCLDILLKRARLCIAQVARILQIRTTKLAQQIIQDWKFINEQMHNECKDAKQYAQSKVFLENIRDTIKKMEGKATILRRYVAVIEEFQINYSDYVKALFNAEETFIMSANLDPASENKKNSLQQNYEIHLINSFGQELELWSDAERARTVYLALVQPKLILKDRETCVVQLNRYFKIIAEQKTAYKGYLLEQI